MGFIAIETTDITNLSQLAIVICYVKMDGSVEEQILATKMGSKILK